MYSIITPTFNRKETIGNSIESSIIFLNQFEDNNELIIVDDASSDNTFEMVHAKYKTFLDSKKFHYQSLPNNMGVTYAKNHGASHAKNEWLVFLDSDDTLMPFSRDCIDMAISDFPDADGFFFRCVSDNDKSVGANIKKSFKLELNDYLKNGTYGECLPVLRKSTFLKYKYDSDLRGFEGLAYLRMLKNKDNLYIIKDAARKYSLLGDDRLSTRFNVFSRSEKLLIGYLRFKDEIFDQISFSLKLSLNLTIYKYSILVFIKNLFIKSK